MVETLRPLLERQDTNMRADMVIEKRVAIGLWHFAHGGTYLLTGDKFGVSASLTHRTVKEFIDAIILKYQHVINFPTGNALMKVMKGFESRRQMPNCCGAIDCSHILISTPSISDHKAYHDRNHQVSVILQAVVDSQGRFLAVFAGYPGSCNEGVQLLSNR